MNALVSLAGLDLTVTSTLMTAQSTHVKMGVHVLMKLMVILVSVSLASLVRSANTQLTSVLMNLARMVAPARALKIHLFANADQDMHPLQPVTLKMMSAAQLPAILLVP
jgi:hypothetical protein